MRSRLLLPKDTHKSMAKIILALPLIVKVACIQLLFSITAIHHWTLFKLEIKAFLHGDPDGVYVEQPPGLFAPKESSNMVCHLPRSL